MNYRLRMRRFTFWTNFQWSFQARWGYHAEETWERVQTQRPRRRRLGENQARLQVCSLSTKISVWLLLILNKVSKMYSTNEWLTFLFTLIKVDGFNQRRFNLRIFESFWVLWFLWIKILRKLEKTILRFIWSKVCIATIKDVNK